MAHSFLSAFLVALLLLLSACEREETGLGPGKFAPELELRTLEGEAVQLSDFRGKTLLLNFWTSWCAPCIAEMPSLQKLQEQFSSEEFEVLAIAVDDDLEAIKAFRERLGLNIKLLHNPGGTASPRYKVNGFPESFFVDKEGKLRLVPDPEDGRPVVRIVGPREWDSLNAVTLVKNLLSLQEEKW